MKNIEILQAHLNQELPETLSPVGNWLNYTVNSAEEGKVAISLVTRPEMANPAQMVHGGILTTIADEAMGLSVWSMSLPSYYVSVDIHINFLYGLPVGQPLVAKGEVIRQGKKIVFATCSIYDQDDRLCATVSSTLVSTSATTPKEYDKHDK